MGGFQLLDLIIPELKSNVIPYKVLSLDSEWRENLVKDFFFTNEFSTNESLVTENPLTVVFILHESISFT